MLSWFNTLSLILNVGLLIWAVYERILSNRDKDYIKASIRVWQHQAQGLSSAIKSLSWASGGSTFSMSNKFSKTTDVGIALNAVHEVAESMSQSLYESRFFTDEELKENIKKDKEKTEKMFSSAPVGRTKKYNKKVLKELDEILNTPSQDNK